ncbi:MAG TPA: mechanosensitive ion channel [Aeromonadales bacterium]|nr:mechanosensitive ion channel [Aeromonadales bacterium]
MFENLDIQKLVDDYLPVVIDKSFQIFMALVIFVIGKWVAKLVTKMVRALLLKAKVDDILADFVSAIVKGALLLVVIIAALDQLGVDTTSLVALIGAAGLAVGLALQNSLQNFAAGVMLLIFRPFKAGDFIDAAGVSGVVEGISIFSTTMRTGDNKEMIIPNGAIYGGIITNFSAKDTRRIDMVVGIGYDDDIRKAKDIIWEVLNADERILKDPAPTVAVSELADSSVNFVVRPWVKSGDYWGVMFDFNEKIKLTFDEKGISIPYPQMDIHTHKVA